VDNIELDTGKLMGVRLCAENGAGTGADTPKTAESAILGMKEGLNPVKKDGDKPAKQGS